MPFETYSAAHSGSTGRIVAICQQLSVRVQSGAGKVAASMPNVFYAHLRTAWCHPYYGCTGVCALVYTYYKEVCPI